MDRRWSRRSTGTPRTARPSRSNSRSSNLRVRPMASGSSTTPTLENDMAESPESTVGPNTPVDLIEAAYARLPERVAIARERLGRPVTFAEKVLFAHAGDPHTIGLARGAEYGDYRPDRVAMQDATAQLALLQFMLAR